MRKRLIAVLTAVFLTLGLVAVGVRYYVFVSRTIYTESIAHLTEIYHQSNRSLFSLVGRNWYFMHMWTPYLKDTADEQQIEDYISHAKEEVGFTDFYFISREGSYRTALSSVPIVAMTANAFDEDRKAAADCGMNGFISKPINMQEVIKALQGVFGII